MTPDTRARQPRDGPMQCGTQPADISVIHRRFKLRASRSPSGALSHPHTHRTHVTARTTLASVDSQGPYQFCGKVIELVTMPPDELMKSSIALTTLLCGFLLQW